MKEARKRQREKKKRQRTAQKQRPKYPDIKPIIRRYDSDSDDEDALPLQISPPEAYTEKLGHYLPEHFSTPTQTLVNCPQHILLETQHLLYKNPLPPITTQTLSLIHI